MKKSMPWFRMYAEFVDDPKVQKLKPDVFKFWMNCLGLACQNNGYLPKVAHIAWKVKLPEKRAAAFIAFLHEAGLLDIEADTFSPHNWSLRQYQSDTSINRVREYRQRLKDGGSNTTAYLKHKADVFKRDGGKCAYCGSGESLCLDHMIPVVLGGDDAPDNLCAACKSCNSGKSGRTPEQAGLSFVNPVTEACYKRALSRLHSDPVTVTVTPPESESESESEKHTTANAVEEKVRAIALEIHGRHPPIDGRRDISASAVHKRLCAIFRHKKTPKRQWPEEAERINVNHAAACRSWAAGDNLFVKSLYNWLAPTIERYDVALDYTPSEQPQRRLIL